MKQKLINLSKMLLQLLEDNSDEKKYEIFNEIFKYNIKSQLKFNEIKLYYHNNYKFSHNGVKKNYSKYEYLLNVDFYNYKLLNPLPKNKTIDFDNIEIEIYKCELTTNKLDGIKIYLKPVEINKLIVVKEDEKVNDSFYKLINDL